MSLSGNDPRTLGELDQARRKGILTSVMPLEEKNKYTYSIQNHCRAKLCIYETYLSKSLSGVDEPQFYKNCFMQHSKKVLQLHDDGPFYSKCDSSKPKQTILTIMLVFEKKCLKTNPIIYSLSLKILSFSIIDVRKLHSLAISS